MPLQDGEKSKTENINEVWNLLSTFLAICLFSNGFWSSQKFIKIATFWTWNLKRSYFRYNGSFRSGKLCTYKKGCTSQSVFYFHLLTLRAEIKGKRDHLNSLKYCNLLQASSDYHSPHIYCYLQLNAITRSYAKATFCSPYRYELQHVVLREQCSVWECKSAVLTRRLWDFTAQCHLESRGTKLPVNISALQKYKHLYIGSTQWWRFCFWQEEMAYYVSQENSLPQPTLSTKSLSAQNDKFGSFHWVLRQSGVIGPLAARFSFSTWCYSKSFSNC